MSNSPQKWLLSACLMAVVPAQAELVDLTNGYVYDLSTSGASWKIKPKIKVPLKAITEVQSGAEYKVILSLIVDKLGNIVAVDIAKSSGNSYIDESAVRSVRQAKLHPFYHNGEAVMGRVILPIVYANE